MTTRENETYPCSMPRMPFWSVQARSTCDRPACVLAAELTSAGPCCATVELRSRLETPVWGFVCIALTCGLAPGNRSQRVFCGRLSPRSAVIEALVEPRCRRRHSSSLLSSSIGTAGKGKRRVRSCLQSNMQCCTEAGNPCQRSDTAMAGSTRLVGACESRRTAQLVTAHWPRQINYHLTSFC